jgi:hypothetical protein
MEPYSKRSTASKHRFSLRCRRVRDAFLTARHELRVRGLVRIAGVSDEAEMNRRTGWHRLAG